MFRPGIGLAEEGESGKMAARVTLTKNQQKVLEKLEVATGPLSAYTLLDQWVGSTGFVAKKAVIEFRGTCAKCAAIAA